MLGPGPLVFRDLSSRYKCINVLYDVIHTSYLLSSIMCLLFKQMQRNDRMCVVVLHKVSKTTSPSGNRTPVSRVTGGDTYHYTNEDLLTAAVFYAILCVGREAIKQTMQVYMEQVFTFLCTQLIRRLCEHSLKSFAS